MDRELKQTAGAFLEQVGTAPTVPTVSDIPSVTAPTIPEPSETQSEEITPEETRPHQQLWADMIAYNAAIYEVGQAGLSDETAYEVPSFTLADYGLDSEIFGVISIPSLDNMNIKVDFTMAATEVVNETPAE